MILIRIASALALTFASIFPRFYVVESTEDKYFYNVYYESNDENCKHALLTKGHVSEDPYSVYGAKGDSCGEEMFCKVKEESSRCKQLEPTLNGTWTIFPENKTWCTENQVYEAWDTNSSTEINCLNYIQYCHSSKASPHCSFDLVPFSELKDNPEIMYNPKPSDLMQEIAYVVYYSDDQCTQLEGLRPFVSGESSSVPDTNQTDLSCESLMGCFLEPDLDGPQCTSLNISTLSDVSFTVKNQGKDIYEYDPTNVDVGQPVLTERKPEDCYQSSLLPTCHFRLISAVTLGAKPSLLVGETGEMAMSMFYQMSFSY